MEKNRLMVSQENSQNQIQLLVIGGSAGSLDVLFKTLPLLLHDLTFPIIIVIHRKSDSDSSLAQLLGNKTVLTVKEADEKEFLKPGFIYLAPADYHLLVEKDLSISLDFSEKVNYSRPSIDVTFHTASDALGTALAGLLISGASSDGVKGLAYMKERGGYAAVQNPSSAEVSYMPQQAILNVDVDEIINIEKISEFINQIGKPKAKKFLS